jgi:hypothetical protein
MKKRTLTRGLVCGLLLLGIGLAALLMTRVQPSVLAKQKPKALTTGYKVTGPYVHENLAIYLIHGPDRIDSRKILTLQEAMQQKKVVVYETGSVNELAIENLSKDEEIYVQSGDIVKGGKQDRVLSVDIIIAPKSGRVPIASFCVESGRWRQRGQEEAAKFDTSSEQLATKDLRLAAKRAKNQGEVWSKVSEAQDKLSRNVGAPVQAKESASSLQLTLENKRVQGSADAYIKKLSNVPDGKSDVIGYAFAINGKLNSADVYASSALFKKLWPKLLKANAVEAIAELDNSKKFETATLADVRAFILDAQDAGSTEQEVTSRVKIITRENSKNVIFETRDMERKGTWIHINYVSK